MVLMVVNYVVWWKVMFRLYISLGFINISILIDFVIEIGRK